MNDGAVADGEFVAVGEVDTVVNFYAGAHVVEDVAREHASEAESEPNIQTDCAPVEHFPKPDEWFADGELHRIHIAEVFGIEGYVLGIEGKAEDVAGELAGEGNIGLGPVRTPKVELMKLVANDFSTALGRAVAIELLVEEADPAAKYFFGFGRGVRLSGGDRLGFCRHMSMDDKPTRLDAANVTGMARRGGGLF